MDLNVVPEKELMKVEVERLVYPIVIEMKAQDPVQKG